MEHSSKPSLRTRVAGGTAKSFWILSLLVFIGGITLLYTSGQSDSQASDIAAMFGFLAVILAIVIMSMALALTMITEGSKKIDSVLSNHDKNQ